MPVPRLGQRQTHALHHHRTDNRQRQPWQHSMQQAGGTLTTDSASRGRRTDPLPPLRLPFPQLPFPLLPVPLLLSLLLPLPLLSPNACYCACCACVCCACRRPLHRRRCCGSCSPLRLHRSCCLSTADIPHTGCTVRGPKLSACALCCCAPNGMHCCYTGCTLGPYSSPPPPTAQRSNARQRRIHCAGMARLTNSSAACCCCDPSEPAFLHSRLFCRCL